MSRKSVAEYVADLRKLSTDGVEEELRQIGKLARLGDGEAEAILFELFRPLNETDGVAAELFRNASRQLGLMPDFVGRVMEYVKDLTDPAGAEADAYAEEIICQRGNKAVRELAAFASGGVPSQRNFAVVALAKLSLQDPGGLERETIADILNTLVDDCDGIVREWAVMGIKYIATRPDE